MIERTETLDKAPIQRFGAITAVDSRRLRHDGRDADCEAHARLDRAPASEAKPEGKEQQLEGLGSDHRARSSPHGSGEPMKLPPEG